MSEIMNKIYYMVSERVGQQCAQDKDTRLLLQRKCALVDEIIFRLGADGEELMDGLTDLSAELETIQDKALFRAALSLGVEVARPRRGT